MTDKQIFHRGFRVFGEIKNDRHQKIVVKESSLAFEGPHCWIFCGWQNEEIAKVMDHEPTPQLSVQDARQVILALELFIEEAEAGQLTEKIE